MWRTAGSSTSSIIAAPTWAVRYYNRRSLIAARVLTRGRDEIDADFFAKRLERARRFREAALPGEDAVRLVYGEADQLPGSSSTAMATCSPCRS